MNKERTENGLPAFANPRNSAAGSLKQLDPSHHGATATRRCFYGTGLIEGARLERHSQLFPFLKKLGLPTTERWWAADSDRRNFESAIRELDKVRHDFAYQTDGAVVKVDTLGATRKARLYRQVAALGDRL